MGSSTFSRAVTSIALAATLASAVPAGVRADASPDYGNPAAVQRIRELAKTDPHVTIRQVVVVGPYALANWIAGEGGGQQMFGFANGGWNELFGGGGAFGPSDLKSQGVPDDVAQCVLIESPQTRPASCAAISATPTTAEASTILVQHYYVLWSNGQFKTMYGMLSTGYRAAHPYRAWLAGHQGRAGYDTSYRIQSIRATAPLSVRFTLEMDEQGKGAADGHLTTTTYDGTWALVQENGALRLDQPVVKQTKTQTF